MNPKDVVSTLITELNQRLSIPAHTAGIEETRPVPAVLVDNISITHKNHHNSDFAGEEWTGGQVTSEIYRHYYSVRIDLVVRDNDEIEAYNHLVDLQQALAHLAEFPRKYLHDDINDMSLLSSGEISYQFNEPTETEINQAVQIETFYDSVHSDFDTIQSVSETFYFN